MKIVLSFVAGLVLMFGVLMVGMERPPTPNHCANCVTGEWVKAHVEDVDKNCHDLQPTTTRPDGWFECDHVQFEPLTVRPPQQTGE